VGNRNWNLNDILYSEEGKRDNNGDGFARGRLRPPTA